MLTEEQRKLLTEDVLGGCWHETDGAMGPSPTGYGILCKYCGNAMYKWDDSDHLLMPDNRTFDNWQDFGALKEALGKKGLWEEFGLFSFEEWTKDHIACGNFADWLIDKDRFPELVAEFMEVKNG